MFVFVQMISHNKHSNQINRTKSDSTFVMLEKHFVNWFYHVVSIEVNPIK